MSTSWRHLPAPARAVAQAATAAIDAAADHDQATLDTAAGALAAADGSGLVLGTVVRTLLEDLHPDGLDGDDVRAVLEHCVTTAGAWYPAVDPQIVLVLLAGALGIHDDSEDARPPAPEVLARHAALLVADLVGPAPRPLAGYLTAAFAEIERTETHD